MEITLALGGGGAKGNAHIGILRRLQQENIRITALAGTSFGGLVAVFYALGHTPDQIEDTFAALDQTQLYGTDPEQGPALLGLAGATRWLTEQLGEKTFADLHIPCALTATDLQCGCEVTLTHGSLLEALLATIAVPGIFPARHIGPWELVDGGVLNPVPVATARALRPDLPVIAAVLTSPLGTPAQTWNIPLPNYLPKPLIERIGKLRYAQALETFNRSLDVVYRAATEYRLQVDKPEVILRPQVTDIDLLAQVDVHAVARKGEEAVEAALPEIKALFTWQSRLRRTLRV